MKEKSGKDKDNFNNTESLDEENSIGYVRNLERKLYNLETEKQLLDAERLRLEQELNSLRNEVDQLREPPLVAAVVVSVDEEKGKASIVSSTGPVFVVTLSRKVRNQKLESGTFVSLNQRTFAIMDILSITEEEIRLAKSKLYQEY